MSDVTAVVLTIGEPYTDRAIASLQRQTVRPADVVVVNGVAPFSRALNAGAAAVRTEFFIQVDADMILDETCIEDLRTRVSGSAGVVVGRLRDPLQGRITGVKLWRTRCWATRGVPDSVTQDVDFVEAIGREGWLRIDVVKYSGPAAHWHSLGEHRPDYNPLYTFSKFRMEAARCRHRQDGVRLRTLFQRLRTSAHGAALIAQIGVAAGIFFLANDDRLRPYARDDDIDFLERFVRSDGTLGSTPSPTPSAMNGDLGAVFLKFSALGATLRRADAFRTFEAYMTRLQAEQSLWGLVATVGLCRGLLRERHTQHHVDEEFARLEDLLGCRAAGIAAESGRHAGDMGR